MKLNIPYQIRAGLYITIVIGTPIVGYLLAKGYIGELEVALWGGLVTAVNSMAVLNVTTDEEEYIG